MQSKYSGKCAVSGERFEAGTEIVKFMNNWVLPQYSSIELIVAEFERMAADVKSLFPADAVNAAGVSYHQKINEYLENATKRLSTSPVYLQSVQGAIGDMSSNMETMKRIAKGKGFTK